MLVDSAGPADVYDLTIEGAAEFFAGGLLVHNCDEVGVWAYPKRTWHQVLVPALRIGKRPRVCMTTTPRSVELIRELVGRRDGSVHITRGSIFDNAANLSEVSLDEMRRRYEGTRLGRQELYGELLEDIEGALWTWSMIEPYRVAPKFEVGYGGGLVNVVVAVDPAATSGEDSDDTGIVIAGRGADGRAYVLADRTCHLSPDGWGRRVVQAYRDFEADQIVAEINNGGEMVQHVLRTVDATIPIRVVHASRGKRTRAEPVAALFEQGKVSMVGVHDELEKQLVTWTPEDGTSPDRLDAMVWCLTVLMLEDHQMVQVAYKRSGTLRGTR